MFIDDGVLESQRGLVRTLHQPVKDHAGERPVIRAAPDCTLLDAYGTIVFDIKLRKHVMFIQSFPSRAMYRVLSSDGMMTWNQSDERRLERITLDTNLGTVKIEMDLSKTPCTAASLTHLAEQKFYDGSEMYEKRVAPVVSRKVDYFHDEIVRILGDNDASTLGSDYPGSRAES